MQYFEKEILNTPFNPKAKKHILSESAGTEHSLQAVCAKKKKNSLIRNVSCVMQEIGDIRNSLNSEVEQLKNVSVSPKKSHRIDFSS